MTTETHKHHFQVADIGAWDLDEDRSIVPSIHSSLKALLRNIQTILPSQKGSARYSEDRKARSQPKVSDARADLGKAVSSPSQAPVSRRQIHKGLPRSERRDSRRQEWQVRNWHRPKGQEQVH